MVFKKKEVVEWRVLPLEDRDIYTLNSLEDALCNAIKKGDSPPTIMFSRVSEPAISLGYNQNIADVRRDLCDQIGIQVARRKTGGRAMYFCPNYLIITMIGNPGQFGINFRNVAGLYATFSERVSHSLRSILGASVASHLNSIMVKDKKICGISQSQEKGVLLVHGYIGYEKAGPLEFDLLRFQGQELTSYFTSIHHGTTSIHEIGSYTFDEFYKRFFSGFLEGLNYMLGSLSSSEIAYSHKSREIHRHPLWIEGSPTLPSKGHCHLDIKELNALTQSP